MPGETGLTRVASDRTVARALVATCARVAPAMYTISSSIRDARRSRASLRIQSDVTS
jgi:hypothetical protein